MPKKMLRFDRFGCGAVAGQMVQNLQQEQQKLTQPVGVVEGYLPDELDFVDQQHFEYSDSSQVGPGYLLGELDDTLG